eukprot:CAMPEP_0115005502 /NCGR_PEP_ID=MMETSP0216-20121206/19909_1 /TAXON_ID=223996 /ORGANISM="Protocruzia adherens, Strain Boccale" /LENGTH=386 /DNA_ID=CAMNT_0002371839 /DNA_START=85 /DNA_END=1245 /DNA_ORIENTATION=+
MEFQSGMPMIIICMGGEMIYILEQRLKAQNVTSEKSAKVLQDVIKSMFASKVVEEFFRPQELFTMQSIRHIFEKLAHCSIMRLNKTSMNKLFDLMSMGIKHQTLACKCPEELYKVTQNHIDTLEEIVTTNKDALQLIQETRALTVDRYKGMTSYQFYCIKQQLAKFFQDKHTRVSLFLQEKIQNNDGSIKIYLAGEGPPAVKIPGTLVRYTNGEVSNTTVLPIPAVKKFVECTGARIPDQIHSELGLNLYSAERRNKMEKKVPEDENEETTTLPTVAAHRIETPTAEETKAMTEVERKAMDSLADILNVRQDNTEELKLNLFPKTKFDIKGPGSSTVQSDIINIGGATESAELKDVMSTFDDVTIEDKGDDDDDDLLDLMDEAAKD